MENNQQTIHLAKAWRVTNTHPGHLDLHPGLWALMYRTREGDWVGSYRWEVRRQFGRHMELALSARSVFSLS